MHVEERSYHHGDLRRALIEEGLRLARDGGLGALGLREITRSVGVTANAAYRHFGDRHDLVVAVSVEARELLAQRIARAMHDVRADRPAPERALRGLRGFCEGYIGFARMERGWFELACYSQHAPEGAVSVLSGSEPLPPPYVQLNDALDVLSLIHI